MTRYALKGTFVLSLAASQLYPQAMQNPSATSPKSAAHQPALTAGAAVTDRATSTVNGGTTANRPSSVSGGSSWTAGGAAFKFEAQKGGIWQVRSSSPRGVTANPTSLPGRSQTSSGPALRGESTLKPHITNAAPSGQATPSIHSTPGTSLARGNIGRGNNSGIHNGKAGTSRLQLGQSHSNPFGFKERKTLKSMPSKRALMKSKKAGTGRSKTYDAAHPTISEPKESETRTPTPRDKP